MSVHRVILAKDYHFDKAREMLEKAQGSEHLWAMTLTRAQKRTLNQNARYWALLQDLSRFTGHAVDELHDMMKLKFLGSPDLSTTKLDPEIMNAYILAIEGWAIGWLGMELDTTRMAA